MKANARQLEALKLGPLSGLRHGNASAGRTREYICWGAIIQRCFNSKNPSYLKYGAKGITVCERWKDFASFLADMGPCPDGHSIDRIDGTGNYEPSNCRWATIREQNRNTSRNHRLSWNGETLTLAEWADRLGLKYDALRSRLRLGWSIERALSTPARQL